MLAKGRLATASHEDSAREARWRIPREGWEKLAEQARGQLVTVNYDRNWIAGRVTTALADAVGVYVEVELTDEFARHAPTPPLDLGPGLVWPGPDGAEGVDFELKEVSLLAFRGRTRDVPADAVLPAVREVRRVALGPEDRLVISLADSKPSRERLDAMKDQLAEVFGIERHRVLIVLGEAALTVVGPSSLERAALEDLLARILEEIPGAAGVGAEEEAKAWRILAGAAAQVRRDLFSSPGASDG